MSRPSGPPGRRHQANGHRLENESRHLSDEVSLEEEPYFGHIAGKVASHHFRLGGINLDNLPLTAAEDKNGTFFHGIQKYQLGVTMFQEVGNNWSVTRKQNQFRERVAEWLGRDNAKGICSHNTHDPTYSQLQYGGTGILTYGKMAHFTMGAGSDKAKLGRWTWARYQGQGGVVLRCVSIYQPCKNEKGVMSVWNQHKQYLQAQNDDRDPRAAFRQDLEQEVQTWLDEGDQKLLAFLCCLESDLENQQQILLQ